MFLVFLQVQVCEVIRILNTAEAGQKPEVNSNCATSCWTESRHPAERTDQTSAWTLKTDDIFYLIIAHSHRCSQVLWLIGGVQLCWESSGS